MSLDALTQRAISAYNNIRRQIAIRLSKHYQRVFFDGNQPSRDAEIVLADLRQYCRATSGCFAPDPYVTARNAGRQEVFQRIVNLLHLDEQQVRTFMEMDSGLD